MSSPEEIDLGLGVLDHQLVDSEGRRCGKVDDLELAGVAEGSPAVVAMLVGSPTWSGRGVLGRLATALSRGRTARVPWDEVKGVDSAVHLKKTASDLRLGRGDDRVRQLVERIPGSQL
jgi:sporulation protein YlmC with PRC-barrel domain